MPHHRVWQFRPGSGREDEFANAYASDGRWARLFALQQGFLGTRLLRPSEPGGAWLTIDSWTDAAAFECFRRQHEEAYRTLDRELEGVAGQERFVGAFDEP